LPARRFPPPWTVEELETCFVVKDGARAKAGVLSKSGVSNLGSPNNAQTFSYTASQERFALMGWHKHALRRGLHFIAIREHYHQLGSGLNA
jgi:hypothetical protein